MSRLTALFVCAALASAAASHGSDLALLPQPCRVLDTRVAAGAIASDSARSISLSKNDATAQGGTSGCGIPATAASARIILHGAPSLLTGGYLKVYDSSVSGNQIFASLVLESPAQYRTVQLDVPATGIALNIYASVTAHAVIDIAGWVDGGGGGSDGFDAPRLRRFLTFANAPFAPEAVSPGDRFIITATDTVGAFVGHENEWVHWDGSDWVFEDPSDGDLGFDAATGDYYRYRALGTAGWSQIELIP